jgi:hypothetical protein
MLPPGLYLLKFGGAISIATDRWFVALFHIAFPFMPEEIEKSYKDN